VYVDPTVSLQHEVHELRLAVAALRAEVADLHERQNLAVPAAADLVADARGPAAHTLVLPLAEAAALAGVRADGVVSLDLGADTAVTEIVLNPVAAPTPAVAAPVPAAAAHESVAPRLTVLPEAPLLDPRLARVAEALDELLGDEAAPQPVGASQRETA
jgi:hypothetical protein